jgi:undecaprenyl diphosphate synthase
MLTLYAFSRENWARSDDEVGGLFELLGRAIANQTEELREQGVHVQVLGRLEELPEETRSSIQGALARTAEGSRLHLNIAWNYAGRTELVDAVRRIVASGVAPEAVDEHTVSEALYTSGLPDPDLLVRTGGERRVSNFLIWQSAYAELVFTDCLWPDFGEDQFDAALLEFAGRTRRFGR